MIYFTGASCNKNGQFSCLRCKVGGEKMMFI